MVIRGTTQGMSEQQLIACFHGREDMLPHADGMVPDPTPAPDPLRYTHLVRNDAYTTLARFAENLIRSRPGHLDGVRFDHGPGTNAADEASAAGEAGPRRA
jgi:hypothetical protein